MNGAREYASLFKTGQHGRLYLVSSSHARGKTFRIYVLPEGEKAMANGSGNGPLNSGAVEVYGAISGQLGWTETYGWIHKGKWVDDFNKMVQEQKEILAIKKKEFERSSFESLQNKNNKVEKLLSDYN